MTSYTINYSSPWGNWSQTNQQKFYFFNSVLLLNGGPIDPVNDWVGAFNGDTLIGAWKGLFDPSLCFGSCAVPVMGDDGYEYSVGYAQTGDIINFKIWDASIQQSFPATPASNCLWNNNSASCGCNSMNSISCEDPGNWETSPLTASSRLEKKSKLWIK